MNNFRIKPYYFQLWMGSNGSGKSSVLDALRGIQRLMGSGHVEDIFKSKSLTLWDTRKEQTFGLSLKIDDEVYEYKMTVEYSKLDKEDKQRIKREELLWENESFFFFDGKKAHLYRINRDTGKPEEGIKFYADWSRSVIPAIAQRNDNKPLTRFREELGKYLLIQPDPLVIKNATATESHSLSEHTENSAQWYRHLLQEQPEISHRAKQHLEKVLPGFSELSLKEIGESRFVSLHEIQPWLDNLSDICDDENKQAIIISHHPEIINRMARGEEQWFSRQEERHVVVKPFPESEELPPAEFMTRGWEENE